MQARFFAVVIAVSGVALSGCSSMKGAGAEAPEVHPSGKVEKRPGEGVSAEVAPEQGSARMRRVGDYLVHRVSGSFREEPLQLKEEVLARSPRGFTVQYTFQEGSQTTVLRALESYKTGAVIEAFRVESDKQHRLTMAEFESFMARASFGADANEGLVDAKKSTCLIGSREISCESKEYSVVVGEHLATLTVTSSKEMPSQDLGGEIRTRDGRILYRTELIEAGHRLPGASGSEVAERR